MCNYLSTDELEGFIRSELQDYERTIVTLGLAFEEVALDVKLICYTGSSLWFDEKFSKIDGADDYAYVEKIWFMDDYSLSVLMNRAREVLSVNIYMFKFGEEGEIIERRAYIAVREL